MSENLERKIAMTEEEAQKKIEFNLKITEFFLKINVILVIILLAIKLWR